ncbi:MAG: hemerythrin domain-containing protein [Nitrosomonadales bacterium]|nr:hemerythrin domain-containing protein [Nitrosomonadales bacterium]
MSQLIIELKKEHEVIANILGEASKLGITSKEGQMKLMDAKKGLLAHLKKEDDQLYPVLKKAAQNDQNLGRTLDFYAKDMEGISKAAVAFFNKYAQGGSGMEFAKDIGGLFSTLKSRIRKEEDVLYKEYDRLNP